MKKISTNYLHIYIPVFVGLIILFVGLKIIESYGIAIFLLLPFFIGFLTTILLKKYRNDIFSIRKVILLSFLNIMIISLGIMLVAIEGLICVAMASPILFAFSAIGALTTFLYIDKSVRNINSIIVLFSISIIGVSFVEKENIPSVSHVTTSIIIDAPIEKVWENVIIFPQLEEPKELLFRAGIAYPINATIDGKGIGAIRYCNFTTGSFVEPITTWNAPHHLAFDVLEQPAPMKEISYWDFDAAHLHDYFISKNGEFRLKKISQNKTELIGTTWYTHHIYPEFYWRLWSNHIIHKIHYRVLNHIKKVSEN